MADQKITELTAYTPAISTDLVPIVDVTTTNTKKITVSNLGIPGRVAIARANCSTAQTITKSSATLIALDTEDYDIGGNFNNTGGNYKFVAPVTGYYHINAGLSWGSSESGVRYMIQILIDSTIVVRHTVRSPSTTTISNFVSDILYLTSGQAISVKGYHESSVDVNLTGGTTYCWLSVHLVAV